MGPPKKPTKPKPTKGPRKTELHIWLRNVIESGLFPEVTWVNKNEGIFQILWVNQKNQKWREENCRIFLEYAKKTGKLKPGEVRNFSRFKQNFKSALHKNKYIHRRPTPGQKGLRIYQISHCSSEKKDDGVYRVEEERQQEEQITDVVFETPSSTKEVNLNFQDLPESGFHSSASGSSSDQSYLNTAVDLITSPMSFPQEFSKDFLDSSQTGSGDGSYNLSQQGDQSLTETGFSSNSLTVEHDINRNFQNLSLLVSGKDQQYELSQIPSFLQSMMADNTTDNVVGAGDSAGDGVTFSGGLNAHILVQGKASTVARNTSLHSAAVSLMGNSPTIPNINSHAVCVPSHSAQYKTKPELSGKFSSATMDKTNQPLSSTLNGRYGQSSNDSHSRMETSERRQSLDSTEAQASVTSSNSVKTVISPLVTTITSPVSEPGLMKIQIIYGTPSRVVMPARILAANKCRIFFGRVDNNRLRQEIEFRDEAIQIELPSVEEMQFEKKSKDRIRKVLQGMELGVLITYRDGNIYVVRRSKMRAFLSDGVASSKLIPRSKFCDGDQEIEAFSYNEKFKKSVEQYIQKKGPIDRDFFLLTFGCEIVANDPSPVRHLPVFISVQHLVAADTRFKEMPDPSKEDAKVSLTDSYDNMLHLSNAFHSYKC